MKSRNFQSKFFTDPYVQELKLDEKYVYLYYLFNSRVNWIGCYEISDREVIFEVSYELTTSRLQEIKHRFITDNKIRFYKYHVILKNNERHENHMTNMQLMGSAYKQYLALPSDVCKEFRVFKPKEIIEQYDTMFCSLQCNLPVGEGEGEREREREEEHISETKEELSNKDLDRIVEEVK